MKKTDSPFHLQSYSTPEDTARGMVNKIIETSLRNINMQGKCSWALSGGSSIFKLYDALKKKKSFYSKILPNLSVFWVDERYVPHENEKSNFGNAVRYFWNSVKGAELFPVHYLETPEKSAFDYEERLTGEGIDPKNSIDITILGMGEDGHTASLFPESKALYVKDKMIVSNYVSQLDEQRITMTYDLINNSDQIEVLAFGGNKGKTFARMMQIKDFKKYPIYNVLSDKCFFHIDVQFLNAYKNFK